MCSTENKEATGKLDALAPNSQGCEGDSKAICILPVCPTSAYRVTVNIGSSMTSCFQVSSSLLIDTGAAVSLLRRDVFDKLEPKPTVQLWSGPQLSGVEGTHLQVYGCCLVSLNFSGEVFEWSMLIVDSLTSEGIIGLDFLEYHSCTINTATRCLHFGKNNMSFPLYCPSTPAVHSIDVRLTQTVQIPARSILEIMHGDTE